MFDVAQIIQTVGLLLIAAIIFAESGMFVGFFLPGDTLLLSAGVFAAQDKLPLAATIIVVSAAAIAGDNIGYLIGRKYGRRLFKNPDALIFHKDYVRRAELFFERFGNKSMLLAHFVPFIRTFAPPAAGIGKMHRKQFIIYDAIGDISWAVILIMVGYWFGSKIPDLDHYILLAVGAVTIITLGPAIYHFHKAVRHKRARRQKTDSSA